MRKGSLTAELKNFRRGPGRKMIDKAIKVENEEER